jgi:hypothetical protein
MNTVRIFFLCLLRKRHGVGDHGGGGVCNFLARGMDFWFTW